MVMFYLVVRVGVESMGCRLDVALTLTGLVLRCGRLGDDGDGRRGCSRGACRRQVGQVLVGGVQGIAGLLCVECGLGQLAGHGVDGRGWFG